MNDFKPAHNLAVEQAKDNLDKSFQSFEWPTSTLETCYIAMLKCQDTNWRVNHQHALCAVREELAYILDLDAQTIQEHYESIAFYESCLGLIKQG